MFYLEKKKSLFFSWNIFFPTRHLNKISVSQIKRQTTEFFFYMWNVFSTLSKQKFNWKSFPHMTLIYPSAPHAK